MTKAVGSVAAGQELWLPNASVRNLDGTIYTTDPPGQHGGYWTFSNGYILQFWSGEKYGRSVASSSKLFAEPVRCVR